MDNQFFRCFVRVLLLGLMMVGAGLLVHRLYEPKTARPGVVARAMQFANRGDGLARSTDPREQARYQSILRRSEALYGQVILRHPDLAVNYRTVLDDQNGFLKWIEFTERYPTSDTAFAFCEKLNGYVNQQALWDRAEAKRWLGENRALVDEVQRIGLLPDRSVRGIAIDRWSLQSTRLVQRCADALAIAARVAAEQGDEQGALASARAAMGLADHFDQIETPNLQLAGLAILIRGEMLQSVLREVIPALPAGRFHPGEWASVLKGRAETSEEYVRVLKGEWHVGLRSLFLPTLVNLQDQGYAKDAEALLDAHAERMLAQIRSFENTGDPEAMPQTQMTLSAAPELSPECRDLFEMSLVGSKTWYEGWARAQVANSMNAAAFEIMSGGEVPNEPISGKPFAWDANRRVLALPDAPGLAFAKLNPVAVPRLAARE